MMFNNTPAISTAALAREGKQNCLSVAASSRRLLRALSRCDGSLPSTPLPPDSRGRGCCLISHLAAIVT
jgi:hypothetical protein